MSGNGHRWSKFWWQDWRSDPALRLCSLAARGLWMEMLCIMHGAGGFLLVNNSRPTHEELTHISGKTRQREVASLLRELEDANVFSRTADGTIFCRRMVNDFKASEEGRANGAKGGNPNLKRNGVNPPPYPNGLTGGVKLEAEAEAEEERETPIGVSARAHARRHKQPLPADWNPSPKEVAVGRQLGLQPLDIDREADRLRDWAAAGGVAKADWDAFFRLWLRDAVFRQRQAPFARPATTADDLRREWDLPSFLAPKPPTGTLQ
jgi:hypothetical protein